MSQKRINYLLEKHIYHQLTDIELQELLILSENISDEEFLNIWHELYDKDDNKQIHVIPDDNLNYIKAAVLERISVREKPRRMSSLIIRWSIAATILLAISFSIYLYFNNRDISSKDEYAFNDIEIQLDSLPKIVVNGKILQTNYADNSELSELGVKLINTINSPIDLTQINKTKLNNLTITTPKGYISKLLLPDSSLVWLNSNSTLHLQDDFDIKSRALDISGEAYFEVVRSTKPFVVTFSKGKVKVLGTNFNVSDYNEMQNSQVSLTKGLVEVQNNINTVKLIPGHSARLENENSIIRTNKFNVSDALSWRNGELTLNESTIEEIVVELKQWYDIEDVEFKVRPTIKLSGILKKSKSLRQLLNSIEKISNHKFHIQGRRVIVTI